jgi:hypothetical protein
MLEMPFDADEVPNNFRRECYLIQQKRFCGAGSHFSRRLYYSVRSLLPAKLRQKLQQAHALGWQKIAFPGWPVDLSLDLCLEQILLLVMASLGVDRLPFIWFWPDGCRSAAIMTHDVETAAGRDFCSQLMDLDESYGLRGSFQLVPEQRYDITEEFLTEIRQRGFEINIHDLNHDGRLFLQRKEFLRRAVRINEFGRHFGALGFRSAVLYRNMDWFEELEFLYDMSVPNTAPLDPQRGGCCTVMPYSIGRLVELPLTTIQDYSLFHVLGSFSTALWEQQIAAVMTHNGLLSFIVHPDYLLEDRARNTYRHLLHRLCECAVKEGAWLTLPREIAQWWKQRETLTLVRTAGAWGIRGDGAERASVAWAVAQEGHLLYELQEATQFVC